MSDIHGDAADPAHLLDSFSVTTGLLIASSAAAVWRLLTDVEAMAGLGPEHYGAEWLDSKRGLGARFVGRNRVGETTWKVPCSVNVWDEPNSFGWIVGDPQRPSSTWAYQLSPRPGGTWVGQTFQHGPGFSFVRQRIEADPAAAEEILRKRTASLTANMNSVLSAVGSKLTTGTT